MNAIITGGAGFIGSNFCCLKKNKFNKIIIIDCLNYSGNIKNLENIVDNEKIQFIEKNIVDVDFEQLFDKYNIDLIIHFAGQTHVDQSYKNLNSFIEDNICATCHILESLRKYEKKVKLIHFSTDEVYGPSYNNDYFNENSNLNPTNPYSASKASVEMFINSYKLSFHLDVIILRCNNAYGIKQHPEKVIPSFINKSINNETLLIHGSGDQIRDFIHVKDISNAVMLLINKGIYGEIYNIGNVNPIKIKDLASNIIKLVKSGNIKHIQDRPFNDNRYYVDCSKLKKLGWTIETNFEEEINEIIHWHKQNPNYWD